jgi:serine/threonine protein kinase
VLGKGSYGEVRLVRQRSTGQLYALKVVHKKQFERQSKLSVLLREIEVHRSLKSTHIVQLYDHFEDDRCVYLLLEYAPGGSLFSSISRQKGLAENEGARVFKEACEGILFLHENNIIHRDIKPENILLAADGAVKICDFGWSYKGTDTRTTFCGTLDYMAPEMLTGRGHSFQVDLWALGVLLFEILHGYAPFNAKADKDKQRQILNAEVRFAAHISEGAKDIISRLIKRSPSERMSLTQVLSHPWLQQLENSPQLGLGLALEEEESVLESIEHWCKQPSRRAPKADLTSFDDFNQSFEVELLKLNKFRLERKSSIQNFEEVVDRYSHNSPQAPLAVNPSHNSSPKKPPVSSSQAPKQDISSPAKVKAPKEDPPMPDSPSSPQFGAGAIKKAAGVNYAAERERIEEQRSEFYTKLEDHWLTQKEAVVVQAPVISETDYGPAVERRPFRAGSTRSSHSNISSDVMLDESSEALVARKRELDRLIARLEGSSLQVKPQERPTKNRKIPIEKSERTQPKEEEVGFLRWIGSLIGCSERDPL